GVERQPGEVTQTRRQRDRAGRQHDAEHGDEVPQRLLLTGADATIAAEELNMFRWIAALCFTAPLAAQAQTVGIVTTPAGSFSNSAGQAVAQGLVDKAKLRTVV